MTKKYILASLLLLSVCASWAQKVTLLNKHAAQVETENGVVYLDFYGENVFRLFHDPKGGVLRAPQCQPSADILVQNPRRQVTPVKMSGNGVSTGRIRVDVQYDGRFSVADLKTGKFVLAQKTPTEFTSKTVSLALDQPKEANFYGGGCQNGRFSHRGKVIAIENTNNWVDGGVSSPAPFFWSTAGYALMPHTFSPGKYDFGATEALTTRITHETDYLDLFVMIDDGAKSLLQDYYQLTGNPVLIPKFGFYEGHLNAYNRDYWTEAEGESGSMKFEDGKTYNESQKDNGGVKETLNGEQGYQFSARAAIDRYLDNDMPLGWFLPNDGYSTGYGQTSTLEGNVENLRLFGEYARSKGVEVGLWTQSDLYPKEGVEPLLQRDIVREVRDAGVRVLKTDVAWVGAGYSFGLNGVTDIAHVMSYYGQEARPFIISVDGWAGTQRYAGIWTGDQTGGEWEYIRFHIPSYIGCGLSGQPNVTSDVDGIFGGRNIPVNVRDYQWKAFTPMQLNMDGWGRHPKYPTGLGEPATSINRNYLKLKSALMPYAYSIAYEAVTGLPMMRAMFLEEENDFTLGTGTQYQYMYGPSILVAPVYKATRPRAIGQVEEGKQPAAYDDVRDGIYLPKGKWMDAYDGKVYEGGRIINDFDAPLWKLPAFLKLGAIVPVTEAHNTPKDCKDDLLKLLLVPGEKGQKSQFCLYDDDGRTQAYLAGEHSTMLIETEMDEKGKYTVTLYPMEGQYDGMVGEKAISLVVPSQSKKCKVLAKVDGKKVPALVAFAEDPSLFAAHMQEMSAQLPLLQQCYVHLSDKVDLTKSTVTIEIEGLEQDFSNPMLSKHGVLSDVSRMNVQSSAEANLATLKWQPMPDADYYEVLFQGQLYSTILQHEYVLEGLSPLSHYEYKVRAVNADGESGWVSASFDTPDDPLRDAIRGMRGECTTEAQSGQSVSHLFDFDETTVWHTDWNATAVPFDLIVDMRSVSLLDKLQYVPRSDAANGTILEGQVEVSVDRQHWTPVSSFVWERTASIKQVPLTMVDWPVRFVRLHVTKAVGNFGSGQQLYVFRVPGSEHYVPGDLNQDGRIDENDLTSYTNYMGLRAGDPDFEGYISRGDLNRNGLIDAYDVSTVAVELENGVSSTKVPAVEGSVTVKASKPQYNAGEEVVLTVTGKGLRSVNAISMALPYDAACFEYVGVEAPELSQMCNLTNVRLHKNGQKAVYPTFVNLGEKKYVEGDLVVMKVKFRALKKGRFDLKVLDGMLLDKYTHVVAF